MWLWSSNVNKQKDKTELWPVWKTWAENKKNNILYSAIGIISVQSNLVNCI